MTKLNHNRPLLRYLDNVRREMGIDARRADTISLANPGSSPTGGDIYPLTSQEISVLTEFFNAIENYLKVESALITAVSPTASKKS